MSNAGKTKWPFGAGPEVISLSATGAQAITVNNQYTIVDGVTTQATGNRTINVTLGANIQLGAFLLVKTKTAGAETTTFGENIDSPAITGEAGKTINQLFVYDGNSFVAAGAQQIIEGSQTIVEDIPETLAPGQKVWVVATQSEWIGADPTNGIFPTLEVGTPWPVKGYKELNGIYWQTIESEVFVLHYLFFINEINEAIELQKDGISLIVSNVPIPYPESCILQVTSGNIFDDYSHALAAISTDIEISGYAEGTLVINNYTREGNESEFFNLFRTQAASFVIKQYPPAPTT